MDDRTKDKIVIATLFGFVGLLCGVISEKWGIARNKVPDTISWNELFSERLDNILILSAITFVFGYLLSNSLKGDAKYLICYKCQTPYDKSKLCSDQCPSCKHQLEKLEGFYQRHPELKGR